MKKILKTALLLPFLLFMASCGGKAPDVGSTEVEEQLVKLQLEGVFGSIEKAPEGMEKRMEVVDIVKVDVDDETRRTKFTFQFKVWEIGEPDWKVNPQRRRAIASYDEDGDLHVQLFWKADNPQGFD